MERMYALLVVLATLGCVQAYDVSISDDLLTHLFSNYSSKSRPAPQVKVDASFQMNNIRTVDVKTGIFALSGWWIIKWQEPRMSWDPSLWPGIDVLVLDQGNLWKPVLVITNSKVSLSAINDGTIPLRILPDGTVHWQPPAILDVTCLLDITNYPFDKHSCSIQMTSVGYTMQELNLTSTSGLLMDYYDVNGEWNVKDVGVKRSEYADTSLDYSRLTFWVSMKRESTYYGINVIFPVIVCGIMTVFVFQVPSDSGEKLSYSLTILLTFVVLMSAVATNLPTTAMYTSLIEMYIALILALSALAVIITIYTVKLYGVEATTPIHPWLRKLTEGFRRALLCKKRPRRTDRIVRDHSFSSLQETGNGKNAHEHDTFTDSNTVELQNMRTAHPSAETGADTPLKSQKEHGGKEPKSLTWPMIADTLDSAMLRVYGLVIGVSTVVFMMIMALSD